MRYLRERARVEHERVDAPGGRERGGLLVVVMELERERPHLRPEGAQRPGESITAARQHDLLPGEQVVAEEAGDGMSHYAGVRRTGSGSPLTSAGGASTWPGRSSREGGGGKPAAS